MPSDVVTKALVEIVIVVTGGVRLSTVIVIAPLALVAHADRVAVFQHLGVSQRGVGHVRVHRAGAVETRPGAAAPADGFVVAPTFALGCAPHGQIVHAAVTGRRNPLRNRLR